jgi:hypothetical protein
MVLCEGRSFSGRERRESEKFILFFDCYNAVNWRPSGNYLWRRLLVAAVGGT